jgi:imidazole glycerol-phosphate synthase subunit HisH
MIAIVDYGAGNLSSVKKAIDWLGENNTVTSDADTVTEADRIVLPGVGHFASTQNLTESSLREAISGAIKRGTPFLGICVGMQWMFEGSDESPETAGLGLLGGRCERFPSGVKSPHVGWNSLEIQSDSRLFRNVNRSPFVYFTHSFRCPLGGDTTASCEYGGRFSAAVERDHIFGVQWHPEKSGDTGLKVLANFCAV